MLEMYPILETGSTLITAIPEINQWHIYPPKSPDSQDAPGPQTMEMQTAGQAVDYIGRLSGLLMAAGPGEHYCRDLRVASGMTVTQISSYAQSLATIIPELVQSTVGKESADGASKVGLGNIALAMRHATPEEEAAYQIRVHEAGGEDLMYLKNELNAADADKEQLGFNDHAIITFQHQKFVLSLSQPDAILATRMFEYLESHSGEDRRLSEVRQEVWRSMTIAERMLFARTEKKVYGKTATPIHDSVDHIFRGLLGGLGMTRRSGTHTPRVYISESPVTVTLEPLPPEEPYDESYRPIIPPGTDKEVKSSLRPQAITEQEVLAANTHLKMSANPSSVKLAHEEAIALLDVIMSDRPKQALRKVMVQPERKQFMKILNNLHEIVQRNLGMSSYNIAYYARTISGTTAVSKGGRIAQVGGQLPKTTKWFIGEEKKLEKYKGQAPR